MPCALVLESLGSVQVLLHFSSFFFFSDFSNFFSYSVSIAVRNHWVTLGLQVIRSYAAAHARLASHIANGSGAASAQLEGKPQRAAKPHHVCFSSLT